MKFTRIHAVLGLILIALVVLALAACAPAPATTAPATTAPATTAPQPTTASQPTTAPQPTAAQPTTAAAQPTTAAAQPTTSGEQATAIPVVPKPVTLQLVKNDQLGNILADGDGNTLYLFTKDVKGTSNCYDKCLAAWPAVYPQGQPTLKEGVIAALVGTTTRKDGSTQLTYNGWPLYYYVKDQKPGDVTGQAVGKVWWVISAEGNPIKPSGLQVASNDKFGKFLADENGNSLYIYTKDTKDTSNCYDKCEVAWPPLLTLGKPTLGDGVSASMVGTTTRKDGTVQVTYNGMPLYYYVKDQKPGDVTGQNVGTVWFLVAPDGTIIKTAP